MPRLSLALACLALIAAATPALADCPKGESEVCLGQCLCLPDPNGVLGPLQEQARQVAAPALAQWLRQSREQSLAEAQPIPPALRAQLTSYFPAQVLDAARYRVGDDQELNAANAMLQNQDVAAVTLIDVIVFREANAAQGDVALWAHELTHVQQYQQLGVEGFADRYVRDYRSLEDPAYALQNRVERSLRAPATPLQTQR
ncbi:MAG: hypothetical protein GAK43_00989 [Stenotrophomonas maltophilia]|nr:MAG: hypothetical protein GAK43_00989 [Stenotrophomonas maltophilia]